MSLRGQFIVNQELLCSDVLDMLEISFGGLLGEVAYYQLMLHAARLSGTVSPSAVLVLRGRGIQHTYAEFRSRFFSANSRAQDDLARVVQTFLDQQDLLIGEILTASALTALLARPGPSQA